VDETREPRPDDWWRSAVVYQIYPRSFADSDGDGVGDLPGVLAHLDHLAELGVDVVWISPFFSSPHDDNGYDISDYEDVDPLFGTLEDLDRLIAGLHERGMKLVMDLVVNHTSDEHAWFVQSRASKDSPKRDWYWWRPAREGHAPGSPGAEPTNWRSHFSGPAWDYDESTGEYYLHLFTRKQPDLNWENPQVREAVYAMMRRWVDRGVDGFRMDVINMISKRVGPEGRLVDAAGEVPPSGGFGGDQYLNGPRVHEFLQEMHAAVMAPAAAAGRRLLTVGETPATPVEQAQLYTDPARGEVDMVFTFEHVDLDTRPGGTGKWDLAPLSLPALKQNLKAWQDGLAEAGWNSLYWNNHDQPRVVSRWGDDGEHRVVSAKAWGTALHLLRGTPYVYQGEELGMTNAHFSSVEQYADVESVNWAREALAAGTPAEQVLHALAVKSRDNARTPMQWDDSRNAGFTTGTPWLPVNPNHTTVNAAAARADADSVFHHYRRLIALRREHEVVVEGDVRFLLLDHEQLFACVRGLGETRQLVVVNLSGDPVAVDLGADDALLRGRLLLGEQLEPGGTLPAWGQSVVLT
jgi:oligo-1,6-glucosidase